MFLISITILFSCKKFDTSDNALPSDILYASRQDKGDIYKIEYINKEGQPTDILVFSSLNKFNEIKHNLEREENEQDSLFVSRFEGLSETAINEMDSVYNFDEYAVYKNFMKNLNFKGKLYDYITDEKNWLNNDMEEALDPDLKYYGLDIADLAMVNSDFAFAIQNGKNIKIYKYFDDGMVCIEDGNIKTLNEISNYTSISAFNLKDFPNLKKILDWLHQNLCLANVRRQKVYIFDGGTKKVKIVTKIKRYIFDVQSLKGKVKIKLYKKNGRKRWKKWRARQLKVAVNGYGRLDQCTGTPFWFNYNRDCSIVRNKFKAKYKYVIAHWYTLNPSHTALYIKDEWLYGLGYVNGQLKIQTDFFDGSAQTY